MVICMWILVIVLILIVLISITVYFFGKDNDKNKTVSNSQSENNSTQNKQKVVNTGQTVESKRTPLSDIEAEKIFEFYTSFYKKFSSAKLYNYIGDNKYEMTLGFKDDKAIGSLIEHGQEYPYFMILCKVFSDSQFLKIVKPDNGSLKTNLTKEIIKNSTSYQYCRSDGIDYLLAENFLGIKGNLMIAIGHIQALYGFSFYSVRVGMMR